MHKAAWHLVDDRFPIADAGLAVPERNTSSGAAILRIDNLDRSDPPEYRSGGVPRGAFNRNVFTIGSQPCMPTIKVACSVAGFDPAINPIRWRLLCRHVLCRYCNEGNYRYKRASDSFEREWRGESRARTFSVFGPDSAECSCTYSDGSYLLGGHGILQVAVNLAGVVLTDFVHVRIGAENPAQSDVLSFLDTGLADADPNVTLMVRAILAHESSYRQFARSVQSRARMTFSGARGYHSDPAQPDCSVLFSWPADPPNFPYVTFDYGVGMTQYTRVGGQSITSDTAWDWRDNLRCGVNLFLTRKLKRTFKPGMTWKDWARASWSAYNGTGPAAKRYAEVLAASPDGLKVTSHPVPGTYEIAVLQPPPALADPGPWQAFVESPASA